MDNSLLVSLRVHVSLVASLLKVTDTFNEKGEQVQKTSVIRELTPAERRAILKTLVTSDEFSSILTEEKSAEEVFGGSEWAAFWVAQRAAEASAKNFESSVAAAKTVEDLKKLQENLPSKLQAKADVIRKKLPSLKNEEAVKMLSDSFVGTDRVRKPGLLSCLSRAANGQSIVTSAPWKAFLEKAPKS